MHPIFSRITAILILVCNIAQAQQGDYTAIVGGRIIDGSGSEPIEEGTLLIRGDRIIAVGNRGDVAIPAGSTLIDASGLTLMPGMINAHGHIAGNTDDKLKVYAAYGITTVLSLGGEDATHVALRDTGNTADRGMTSILVAGPIPRPLSEAEAPGLISNLSAMQVDWVKIHVQNSNVAPAVYTRLVAEAHAKGLPVAAHMYNLADARGLVSAGTDMLAHSVRDLVMDQGLLTQMKEQDTCLSPTLAREVSTFAYAVTPDFFSDPFFLQHADPDELAALQDPQAQRRAAATAAQGRADLAMAQRNLKLAADTGIRIAMGTDSGAFGGRFPGYFEHMELQLMVAAGLSEAEAIRAATAIAAECIGISEEVGTLTPGKRADFLLLTANPLVDILNTHTLEAVWISGKRL